MLSNVTVSGIVTREITQSNTEDGKLLGDFVVTIARKINRQTGEMGSFPILVKLYGDAVVAALEQVSLNTPVVVTGTLIQEQFDNGEGGTFKSIVIQASGVLMHTSAEANFDSVAMIGRLGKDPELRYFESGSCVASTTIAFSQTKDQSSWFDIKAWGKTAEVLSQYCKKGNQVGVQGSLDFEQWISKESGQLNQKPVIHIQKLELIGDKSKAETVQYGVPNSGSKPVAQPAQNANSLF